MVNLFSGIKYQEADVADRMNYVVNDYNIIPKETKIDMDMYRAKDWIKQTPEGMLREYIQQQEKAFAAQFKIYQTINTARQAGFDDDEIEKMLTKTATGDQRISNKKATALMEGEFYPIPIADGS